jgi:hypothetical protein
MVFVMPIPPLIYPATPCRPLRYREGRHSRRHKLTVPINDLDNSPASRLDENSASDENAAALVSFHCTNHKFVRQRKIMGGGFSYQPGPSATAIHQAGVRVIRPLVRNIPHKWVSLLLRMTTAGRLIPIA